MPSQRVRVGEVVKPHGIRGELVVDPAGDTLLSPLAEVEVFLSGKGQARRVRSVRPHKGRLLLQLEGIDDRNAAETLRGAQLRVRLDELPELGEVEMRVDDLLGSEVWTSAGQRLGVVRDVLESTGQDLLEIDTGTERVLLPMARDWLVELHAGRIVLDPPAGLLDGGRGND